MVSKAGLTPSPGSLPRRRERREEAVIQQMTHSCIPYNCSKCHTQKRKGAIKACVIFIIRRKQMLFLKSTLPLYPSMTPPPPFCQRLEVNNAALPKDAIRSYNPCPGKGWNSAPQAVMNHNHKICVPSGRSNCVQHAHGLKFSPPARSGEREQRPRMKAPKTRLPSSSDMIQVCSQGFFLRCPQTHNHPKYGPP